MCLNESLHVQYHDDQNLENIYKITVAEISFVEPRILVQISENSEFWPKNEFWSNSNFLFKIDKTYIVVEEFDFEQLQGRQLPFVFAFLQFVFYDLLFL